MENNLSLPGGESGESQSTCYRPPTESENFSPTPVTSHPPRTSLLDYLVPHALAADPLPNPGTGHLYVRLLEKDANGKESLIRKSGGYVIVRGPYLKDPDPRKISYQIVPGKQLMRIRGVEGPRGTFKFFNLPGGEDYPSKVEWHIARWGHQDYKPDGGFRFEDFSRLPGWERFAPRVGVTNGKTILDVYMRGDQALKAKSIPRPPEDKFNTSDYGYVRRERELVTDVVKNSGLDCNAKNRVLKEMEQGGYFTFYEIKPKVDFLYAKTARISQRLANDILNAEGVEYSTLPPKEWISTEMFPKPPPAMAPPDRSWPYVRALNQQVRKLLFERIRLHRLGEDKRLGFLPYAQELYRAEMIHSMFKGAGNAPQGRETVWADLYRNKQEFRRQFPQEFNWFYTYWFPTYKEKYAAFNNPLANPNFQSSQPNDRNWTRDELAALTTDFFDFFYNNDARSAVADYTPVEVMIFEAGALKGFGLVGKLVGGPLGRLWNSSSSVRNRVLANLSTDFAQIEQEATRVVGKEQAKVLVQTLKQGDPEEAEKALIRALGSKGRAEAWELQLGRKVKQQTQLATQAQNAVAQRGSFRATLAKHPTIQRGVQVLNKVKPLACKVIIRPPLILCYKMEQIFAESTLTGAQQTQVISRVNNFLQKFYKQGLLTAKQAQEIATKLRIGVFTKDCGEEYLAVCIRWENGVLDSIKLHQKLVDWEEGEFNYSLAHEIQHYLSSARFSTNPAYAGKVSNGIKYHGIVEALTDRFAFADLRAVNLPDADISYYNEGIILARIEEVLIELGKKRNVPDPKKYADDIFRRIYYRNGFVEGNYFDRMIGYKGAYKTIDLYIQGGHFGNAERFIDKAIRPAVGLKPKGYDSFTDVW